jgi:fermentation-respiration switch protein FrsA (DUF1100 family)
MFSAYDRIYNWNRLDDIFQEPYSNIVSSLFDGSQNWSEINSQLPSSFNDLIESEFINNYVAGIETEIYLALDENTLLDWLPEAPIHFFHGDEDQIVPYFNTLNTINEFQSRGATNIQLTTIPGGNHQTSGRDAVIGTITWFESFGSPL